MILDVINQTYNFKIFINSTGFTFCVLLFMIILSIIYYRKRKSGTSTSSLFFALMILVFLPLIFEILSYASVCFLPLDFTYRKSIIDICFSIYIISSMFWLSIFTFYVVVLVIKNIFKKMQGDDNKLLKYRIIAYCLSLVSCIILGMVLPYDIMYTGENGLLFLYKVPAKYSPHGFVVIIVSIYFKLLSLFILS